MSNFQQPGIGGDKFEAANHNGHLLLFFPTTFRAAVKTANGEADCVDTRIVDLDTGQVLDDAKVWGKAMVPQLKGAVPDGMVLGRLAQGQGKAGNNPPWILQPHTEQDVYRAEQWIAANPRVSQPQSAPPTPPAYGQQGTQQGWGAPAPAAAPAAPATGGWGQAPQAGPTQGGWGAPAPAAQSAPAAPAQSQFEGQWPAQAAQGGWGSPAPAPVWGSKAGPEGTAMESGPQIDPGLVAALQSRGVDPAQLQNQAHAEQIAAAMGLTRS